MKTKILHDRFHEHFEFSPLQLDIIKQIASETEINEEIIKDFLYTIFLKCYRELHIDETSITVDFKHFKLIFKNQKHESEQPTSAGAINDGS